MSTYRPDGGLAPSQATGFGVGAVRRPATLTVAFLASVSAAVLYIVGAILIMVGGKDAIRSYLADELGVDSSDIGQIEQLFPAEFDDANSTLMTKATVAIVVGAIVLVAALLARGGATWARALLAGVLGVSLCAGGGLQIGEAEVLPSASVAIVVIASLLAVTAIAVLFLPASNRYARARKANASRV
jgi:hypothetical protein